MEGAASVTISTVISAVTTVFMAGIGWVGSVASTIAGQPILLFSCVGVPGMYLGVRLFNALRRSRG